MQEIHLKLQLLLEALQEAETSRVKEANWLSPLTDMIQEIQEKLLIVEQEMQHEEDCLNSYKQTINEAYDSRND